MTEQYNNNNDKNEKNKNENVSNRKIFEKGTIDYDQEIERLKMLTITFMTQYMDT